MKKLIHGILIAVLLSIGMIGLTYEAKGQGYCEIGYNDCGGPHIYTRVACNPKVCPFQGCWPTGENACCMWQIGYCVGTTDVAWAQHCNSVCEGGTNKEN